MRVSRSVLAAAPILLLWLLAAACGGGDADMRIDRLDGATSPGATASPAPAAITVFLDPGHGGRDPGYGASFVLPGVPPEKQLTLDLAQRTAARLERDGFRVVFSRTTDTDANEPERDINGDGVMDIVDELQARADLANASGAAVMLSIHFNGLPGSALGGSLTEYNPRREFSDRNRRFAQLVQREQRTALTRPGYTPRDWGALPEDALETGTQAKLDTGYHFNTLIGPAGPFRPRPTTMPAAIAEPLFLTNEQEAALAMREDVRDALADGYARAVREFLADASTSPCPTAAAGETRDPAACRGGADGRATPIPAATHPAA